MTDQLRSPYERALDLTGLDPHLERYFAAIAPGEQGVGRGTFTVVGTPRRWLWPLLFLLALDGIVAPVWQRDVPFVVRNRPNPDGSLSAQRRFDLESGSFTMIDRMTARGGLLFDYLGRSGRLAAMFSSVADAGALRLRSVEVRVRLGRHWLRVPASISPRVDLVESWHTAADLQHVSVVLSLPFVGRIYEYAGSFSYGLESQSGAGE